MRKDIYKEGIEHRFSSTNQPANQLKRVPKWKAHLKKLLSENYNEISQAVINKCKEGDIKHIEFLRDWLYGKPTQPIEDVGEKIITVRITKDDNE